MDQKTKIVTIEGVEILFNFPTIGNKIAIEATKNFISRGQYQSLLFAIDDQTIEARELIEAVATLTHVTKVIKPEKENFLWENLSEERSDFVMKVYKEYQEWRGLFRNKSNRTDGADNSNKIREGNNSTEIQADV